MLAENPMFQVAEAQKHRKEVHKNLQMEGGLVRLRPKGTRIGSSADTVSTLSYTRTDFLIYFLFVVGFCIADMGPTPPHPQGALVRMPESKEEREEREQKEEEQRRKSSRRTTADSAMVSRLLGCRCHLHRLITMHVLHLHNRLPLTKV